MDKKPKKKPSDRNFQGFLLLGLRCRSLCGLTLGELTGLSCFAEAVLLTLDNSGINSE